MNTTPQQPLSNGGLPLSLSGDRLLRGTSARWNETAGWHDRDGLPLPETMFVIGYTTALQKWKDKKSETITEHPLPDPKELNATIPVKEWEIGLDGKPQPPWKLVYVIYMIDLNTGAIYTFANSTNGAKLAYEQLEEQVAVMRMLRSEHVLPIVHLEKRPMKTQYGMKSRPHLRIIEWRVLGGGDGPKLAPQPAPQLAAPAAAPGPAPAPTPAPTSAAPAPAATPAASTVLDNTKPVAPVTVAELIADELPPWA